MSYDAAEDSGVFRLYERLPKGYRNFAPIRVQAINNVIDQVISSDIAVTAVGAQVRLAINQGEFVTVR